MVKFTSGKKIIITTSQRSDNEEALASINKRVRRIFAMMDAEVKSSNGYPGWTPNPQSPILKTTKAAYRELFGNEPVVRAIHAGLECGLFSEKYPGLDMVSYGPTLRGVHSPDEKLLIPTVKMCWDLTVEFLKIVK